MQFEIANLLPGFAKFNREFGIFFFEDSLVTRQKKMEREQGQYWSKLRMLKRSTYRFVVAVGG